VHALVRVLQYVMTCVPVILFVVQENSSCFTTHLLLVFNLLGLLLQSLAPFVCNL